MKLRVLISTLLCVPALLAGHDGRAQDPAGQVSRPGELVVVAHRHPRAAGSLTTAVSAHDADDIHLLAPLALTDFLARLPGIQVSATGGLGAVSTLRIRGEEGYRTLTLIDGLRIDDPSAPQIMPQLEHLAGYSAERVEVLRGPQGLGYGADAGGVVRIESITEADRRKGLSARLQSQSGTRGTQLHGFSLRGGTPMLAGAMHVSHTETAGHNQQRADTPAGDRDGYRNDTLHGTLSASPAPGLRLDWVGRRVDAQSEYDGCFLTASSHDCLALFSQSGQRLGLSMERDSWSHSLSWQQVDTGRDYRVAGSEAFSAEGRLERLEYLGRLSVKPWLELGLGADWQQAATNDFEQGSRGTYAELLASAGHGLTLTAGIRQDDIEHWGRHGSWRLGLAWLQPLGQNSLKWRAAAGTGFRSPSPYEQAYNAGPFAYAPAAGVTLGPERSRGVELGVDYYAEGLFLQATWFDQQVENAILFDLAEFSGYLQEEGASRSRGVELVAEMAIGPQWLVTVNHTYNEAGQPDGSQRFLRPRHLANAGLEFRPSASRWRAGLAWQYVGKRRSEAAGGNDFLPAYRVVDATVWHSVAQGVDIFAKIGNMLGMEYEAVRGYPAPGRQVSIGVSVNFVR